MLASQQVSQKENQDPRPATPVSGNPQAATHVQRAKQLQTHSPQEASARGSKHSLSQAPGVLKTNQQHAAAQLTTPDTSEAEQQAEADSLSNLEAAEMSQMELVGDLAREEAANEAVHAVCSQLEELELTPLKQLLKLCGQHVSVASNLHGALWEVWHTSSSMSRHTTFFLSSGG